MMIRFPCSTYKRTLLKDICSENGDEMAEMYIKYYSMNFRVESENGCMYLQL